MTDETEDLKHLLEIDPAQVEREMLADAHSRAMDPMEMASQMYGMYVPHYKGAVDKLSSRALRRILNFLVLYPFEQDDVKAASKDEQQLMQLCNSLLEAKFVMTMHAYNENAEKVFAAQNSELTEEEKAQVIADFKAAGVTDEDLAQYIDKVETTEVE